MPDYSDLDVNVAVITFSADGFLRTAGGPTGEDAHCTIQTANLGSERTLAEALPQFRSIQAKRTKAPPL